MPATYAAARASATTRSATAKPVPGWVTAAAVAVPLCVLPSATWRLSHVIGVVLFGPGPCDTAGEGAYLVSLSLVSLGAACLTLGLVRPWGEVFPHWIPFLGGKTVPVRGATIAATAGATMIALLIAYYFAVQAVAPDWTVKPLPPGCTPPDFDILVYYVPLIAWPPLLFLVTWQYYRRRTTP